jgi:glycosyltransferase involved in cell wall biosynthesis
MNTKNVKLLFLVNYLPHYRLPIINKLSEFYDLTVAHYGKEIINERIKFKQVILKSRKIGPFIYFKENIYKLSKNYNAVLSLSELRVVPNIRLGFRKKRRFALIYWGIGVSASYGKKYDQDKKLDWLRFNLMNNADSILFYSEYPVKRYIDFGIPREKLFVAHNTVEVSERIPIPNIKSHFLFVGTLYKVKKIYDLLEAYNILFKEFKNIPPLIIIGDGDERANIEKWIIINGFTEKVFLKGAITKQNELKEFYKDAIACISPGQAGLTVLNSMAYGVPFVTTPDAITGGEILNINKDINGLFYDGDIVELSKVLKYLANNPQKVYELSINAQNFYFEHRSLDKMTSGFIEAINYAISSRKAISMLNHTQ